MVNKKYKKCFCVKEINETNTPDSDETISLIDKPFPIKEEQLIDLPINSRVEDDDIDQELKERLARLKKINGGYKRTKTIGERLVRDYSYKRKKGGKRSMKKRSMKKRSMKKRSMKKRSMKKRSMKKRSMKKRN